MQTTGNYSIFSNVPYAKQPVDDLRFKLPVSITGNSSTINDGSVAAICVQGAPIWTLQQAADADGVPVEIVEEIFWNEADQTESCLVLDVYVPSSTFNKGVSAKTPVLVYIHGGGYAAGSKAVDPAGLIARSQLDNGEGVVIVAVNYRLGMYGFLGGANDTIPNLGLHDQLMAMQWVQQYISLFGGDPEQVTLIGESAGASSIVFHITSYGGKTTLPFKRAIPQSPAFQFNINSTAGYKLTMAVASNLTGTNISTVAELSALDAATLKSINEHTILQGSWGNVVFGPAPDGAYVPKLPQVLLAEGAFNKDIELLIGHNSNESATFVDPSISNETEMFSSLEAQLPEASNATLDYILDVLYPAANYSTQFQRAVQIRSDAYFACTTRYLALAKGNDTYNYLFAVTPGYHADDTQYTFYDGDSSTLDNGYPVDVSVAYVLQDSILGFVQAGDPNKAPVGFNSSFPLYGSDAQVLALTLDGLMTETDDLDNVRCAWWQQAMIDGLV
ncbi:Carboxylesterase patB [Lachnellula cervina]|uniref:Carboxylic ester hydrolase n=1 Tax=Lachnellula cervina TaxID=1316786 RepID=A0A7D8YTT8_9HELO|nr:Carboxylesterase patB [Lachnellula cervina]